VQRAEGTEGPVKSLRHAVFGFMLYGRTAYAAALF
jgi:hypothetical protein